MWHCSLPMSMPGSRHAEIDCSKNYRKGWMVGFVFLPFFFFLVSFSFFNIGQQLLNVSIVANSVTEAAVSLTREQEDR